MQDAHSAVKPSHPVAAVIDARREPAFQAKRDCIWTTRFRSSVPHEQELPGPSVRTGTKGRAFGKFAQAAQERLGASARGDQTSDERYGRRRWARLAADPERPRRTTEGVCEPFDRLGPIGGG